MKGLGASEALAELGDLNAKPKALLPSTEPGILAATRHLEAVAEEAKSFLGKQVALRGANYEQQSGVLGTLLSVRDTYKEDLQELKDAAFESFASLLVRS